MNESLLVSAQAATITVAVTNSASTSVALPNMGLALRVVNEGPSTAYFSVGTGSQTATVPPSNGSAGLTTCCPVLAGTDCVFRIDSTQLQNFSAITSSGNATLRLQVGHGS